VQPFTECRAWHKELGRAKGVGPYGTNSPEQLGDQKVGGGGKMKVEHPAAIHSGELYPFPGRYKYSIYISGYILRIACSRATKEASIPPKIGECALYYDRIRN
jgi:hypothetical protein